MPSAPSRVAKGRPGSRRGGIEAGPRGAGDGAGLVGDGVVRKGGGHPGARAGPGRQVAFGDQLLQGDEDGTAGASEIVGEGPRAGEAGAAGDPALQDRAAERVADPRVQGRPGIVREIEDQGQVSVPDPSRSWGFGHEVVQSMVKNRIFRLGRPSVKRRPSPVGSAAMYQPPHFREDDLAAQHGLMRAHPLGLLVTAGPGGLTANPIPFLIDDAVSERGTLRAHLARANPQWRELAAVEDCLVVFQGPQGYVTPSWYATKRETGKVVPTWNYATVHVWGRPRVIEDPDWLRAQIADLTDLREAGRPEPWAVDDAPKAFTDAQLRGIVGVEIPIRRIEGKWKVSQNRPEADRRGVIAGLRATGDHPDRAALAMAALVQERSGR